MSEPLSHRYEPTTQEIYHETIDYLGSLSLGNSVERPLLTWTEFHDLELASLGTDDKDAAASRYVSPAAVRAMLSIAAKRLGAVNTPHAVSIAIESLLLPITIGHENRHKFNPGEVNVLSLISAGRQNSQICFELGISIREVKRLAQDAQYKLGARSRPHAVRRGYEVGILYPPLDE